MTTRGFWPQAWYPVRRSEEVQPGSIIPFKALKQDLILARSPSGKLTIMEGHCPHRGASIGHGGIFVGECVRCPFHGLQYDLNGMCVAVPGMDRVPKAAVLATYPVAETLGMIWMFNGPKPTFPPPTLEGFHIPEQFPNEKRLGTAYAFRKYRKCQMRDAICGALDYQHANLVHEAHAKLVGLEEPSPHEIVVTLDVQSLDKRLFAQWRVLGMGDHGTYRGHYWGPSIVYTRAWGKRQRLGHIRACLPIDEENVQTDMVFIVRLRPLTKRPAPITLAYRTRAARRQDDDDEFMDHQKPRAMFIKNFDEGVFAHYRMCLRMGQTAHLGREPFVADDESRSMVSQNSSESPVLSTR
jgi:phenylpropionate dioxygenase-like ring-hydroxylating dioxygenase large terminal subunit